MFLITHDMEAALICDKSAILRNGKLLEFDTNDKLISKLPSNGLIVRLTIKNLNEEKITIIRNFVPIKKILRVGNEVIEIFMENFEENLQKLIQYIIENDLEITSMSRDIASFRRFFQIRIQDEEEKEKKVKESEKVTEDKE